MSASFCDCVNQWEKMRKLVRIASANRYKIFVTLDKGWGMLHRQKSEIYNANKGRVKKEVWNINKKNKKACILSDQTFQLLWAQAKGKGRLGQVSTGLKTTGEAR